MDIKSMFSKTAVIGTADQIWMGLIIALVLAIVGGLLFYIFSMSKFKHKFRIKEVINGRKIVRDDRARDYKTKDGVIYWRLLKRKENIPVPPPEAIELDSKGRKCVEAYRLETGEYIFIKDVSEVIPRKIIEIENEKKREEEIKKWAKDKTVIEAFQPLTTKQRLIMINQIKKAQERRTMKWQDYILPVVGIGAVVILVVALMIFYGDMAKPLLEMGDKLNAHAQIQKNQLEIIQEIKQDIQVIRDEKSPPKRNQPPN